MKRWRVKVWLTSSCYTRWLEAMLLSLGVKGTRVQALVAVPAVCQHWTNQCKKYCNQVWIEESLSLLLSWSNITLKIAFQLQFLSWCYNTTACPYLCEAGTSTSKLYIMCSAFLEYTKNLHPPRCQILVKTKTDSEIFGKISEELKTRESWKFFIFLTWTFVKKLIQHFISYQRASGIVLNYCCTDDKRKRHRNWIKAVQPCAKQKACHCKEFIVALKEMMTGLGWMLT